MSAFTDSGRLEQQILKVPTVCKRPEADLLPSKKTPQLAGL